MSKFGVYLIQHRYARQLVSSLVQKEDGFYIKESTLTTVCCSIDKNGKKIEKDSPFYELSNLITDYNEGKKASIDKKNFEGKNLEEYFASKGEHFCAGYLSKFGTIKRILNNELYTASSNAYNALREKNTTEKLESKINS